MLTRCGRNDRLTPTHARHTRKTARFGSSKRWDFAQCCVRYERFSDSVLGVDFRASVAGVSSCANSRSTKPRRNEQRVTAEGGTAPATAGPPIKEWRDARACADATLRVLQSCEDSPDAEDDLGDGGRRQQLCLVRRRNRRPTRVRPRTCSCGLSGYASTRQNFNEPSRTRSGRLEPSSKNCRCVRPKGGVMEDEWTEVLSDGSQAVVSIGAGSLVVF